MCVVVLGLCTQSIVLFVNRHICLLSRADSSLTSSQVTHNFDFDNIVQTLRYDYHTQVKLVNYIRRKVFHCLNHFCTFSLFAVLHSCAHQTHQLVCVHCELKLPSFSDLLDHLEQEDHCRLPANRSVWDQAQ